jgi:hypothetical protein
MARHKYHEKRLEKNVHGVLMREPRSSTKPISRPTHTPKGERKARKTQMMAQKAKIAR